MLYPNTEKEVIHNHHALVAPFVSTHPVCNPAWAEDIKYEGPMSKVSSPFMGMTHGKRLVFCGNKASLAAYFSLPLCVSLIVVRLLHRVIGVTWCAGLVDTC